MDKPKVMVFMPCAGPVDPRAAVSLNMATVQAQAEGVADIMGVLFTDRVLVDQARNHMVESALKTDAEWFFWADSDMVFHPRTISLLMETAKKKEAKLVTGVYYKRLPPHSPVIFRRSAELLDGKTLKSENEKAVLPVMPAPGSTEPFEVDAMGFGCVLCHRSVFDNLEKPYFFFQYQKGGDMVSEDINFCEKVRNHGIIIWADPRVVAGHIAEAPIVGADKILESDFKLSEIKR